MSWQQPKTDWAVRYDEGGAYAGDYFEAEDYERIRGNLLYLQQLAQSMYPATELPEIPQVTNASFGYASTIDVLERALDALADGTFDPGIPARKHWEANAPAPLAEDLNRIEGSCLQLYGTLMAQANACPRVPFILGGVQFGR